jgi:fructose-1,6-bisphosphatase I
MVSDVHRNLLYGGVYLYPSNSKMPNGKLRLIYEANPMAFIVEQAGGSASNGQDDIMKMVPESIHQRVPLFIGCSYDVRMIEEYIKGERN